MLTPIKTVDGIQISVDNDGKFIARINEKDVKKASISAIEKQILALRQVVTLYDMQDHWRKKKAPVHVMGYEHGRVRDQEGKLHSKYGIELYHLSEKDILEVDKILGTHILDTTKGE